MKVSTRVHLCLAILFIFFCAQSQYSDSQYKYTLAPGLDFYFAHISYSDVWKDGADPLVFRFRDWNPDMTFAYRSGVTIQYSSRTNEVHCPEIGISSRGVVGSLGGEDFKGKFRFL